MPGRREQGTVDRRALTLGAVGLCLVVGVVLRLGFFGDSLYADEIGAFSDVSGHGLGRVIYLLAGHSPELNPPLYFIVAWVSEQLLGTSAQALRAIDLAAGVAVIPLTYRLGRATVDARTGLAGAALVAVMPFLVFYSSEARPYALMLALTMVSTLALLAATAGERLGPWALYAVVSCAAIYTHFTAVFVLVVQFAWCAVARPAMIRRALAAGVVTAVGFAPWLPNLIRTAGSPGPRLYGSLEPLTLHAVGSDLPQLWVGDPQLPVGQFPGWGWPAVAAVTCALAAAVAGALALRGRGREGERAARGAGAGRARGAGADRAHLALLAGLAFGVPLLTALYSLVRPSVWNSRDLIASAPAFAVLVGALLTRPPRPLRWAAVAVVVASLLISDLRMRSTAYHRPDYRDLATRITRLGPPGAPVVNWPDLSPGPPTELEVALSIAGGLRDHPVLRLGTAPLPEILRAPPYTPLLPHTGQAVAHQAVALARRGTIFLVVPGPIAPAALEHIRVTRATSTPHSNILQLLAAFMAALPPRFALRSAQVFPGVHRPELYVFRALR